MLEAASQGRWLPCPQGPSCATPSTCGRAPGEGRPPDDFLPPAWLARTPFDSWVLPGIGLLLANAVLPTVALVVEARGLPRAFLAHAAVGGVLVGWITLQLLVIGYVAPAFQIGYLSLGLVILGLALRGLRGTARSGTA